MHASSLENMAKCYERFIGDDWIEARGTITVLDVGGANVRDGSNRSYREVFSHPAIEYTAADIVLGQGVDLVLDDPYKWPLANHSFDIVVSGQMLEHCEFFWLAFAEMVRVVKEDGLIIVITPSSGPIHQYPVDCYRFYPDAFRALAKFANVCLWDVWTDNRGPWRNLVGVFGKQPVKIKAPVEKPLPGEKPLEIFPAGLPEEERVSGELDYIEALKLIHQILKPELYFEVGVYQGRSLQLAHCPAIAVDPSFCKVARNLANVSFYQRTSDEFFEHDSNAAFVNKPDLIFIDGLHIFEHVLRDFMNSEKIANPSAVVVIDDIYPNHPKQASRNRCTAFWTGDVWKLYVVLRKHRPDLLVVALNTSPTGLLVVFNLDPNNTVLWDQYDYIIDFYRQIETPPEFIFGREAAIKPNGLKFKTLLRKIFLSSERGKTHKIYSTINGWLYRRLWKS